MWLRGGIPPAIRYQKITAKPHKEMIYTVTLNPALDLELTVDAIAFDTVLRARSWRVDWGGKGFNVARALAALGVFSVALGFVGGKTGEQVAAGLEGLGIATDFVHIARETRTNISVVTEPSTQYLKVNEAGPEISSVELGELVEKVRQLARSGDYWVFSGNLPPGAPADIYAGLIRIVEEAGGKAILDTSGEALQLGCLAAPTVVKPNAEEISQLTGLQVKSIQDACQAAAQIHAFGVKIVMISLGRLGACLSDGTHLWSGNPPAIQEHNPIGAGDAMVAGLTWSLSRSLPNHEVLRYATACGAAAASLPGTQVGSRSLVESLVQQIKVDMIG